MLSPSISPKDITIQNLDFRLKSVKKSFKKITEENKAEKTVKFYTEVTYFVQCILSDEILSGIFLDLIQYEENIKKNEKFQNVLGEIKYHLIHFAKILTTNYLENDFILVTKTFLNPFNKTGSLSMCY